MSAMHVDAFSGAVTVVVFAGFGAVGRLISSRDCWEWPLLGWALIYGASLLLALVGLTNLQLTFGLFVALSLMSLWRHRSALRLNLDGAGYALIALPLLVLAAITPSQSADSYTHWLLNASYMWEHDHYVSAPLDNFHSRHPTYPAALPLTIYFASVVGSRLAEGAGVATNAIVFVLATGCVASFLRVACPPDSPDNRAVNALRYLVPALTFCFVLPLNPSTQPVLFWSAMADPLIAVTVMMAAIHWSRNVGSASTALAPLFLLGCLIGALKQSAWPLAVIFATSAALVGTIERIPMRRWTPPTAALASGIALMSFLWSAYLATRLAVPDQFFIRPLHEWRFDLVHQLLWGLKKEFIAHWFYYTWVIATMALAVATLFRRSLIAHRDTRLLVGFTSLAMLLHVMSLVLAYLGTGFADWEVRTAASFQRYSAHVGYSVTIAGFLAVAPPGIQLARRAFRGNTRRVALGGTAVLCVLVFVRQVAAPALEFAHSFAPRWEERRLAAMALRALPPGDHFAVAAPFWSLTMLNYVLSTELRDAERPVLLGEREVELPKDLPLVELDMTRWLADPRLDGILLLDETELGARRGLAAAPDQLWSAHTTRWVALDLGRGSPHQLQSGDRNRAIRGEFRRTS